MVSRFNIQCTRNPILVVSPATLHVIMVFTSAVKGTHMYMLSCSFWIRPLELFLEWPIMEFEAIYGDRKTKTGPSAN